MESENTLKDKFRRVVQELDFCFPELDLRFNFQSGKSSMRFYSAGTCTNQIIELDLRTVSAQSIVTEAIFCLKQASSLFDS